MISPDEDFMRPFIAISETAKTLAFQFIDFGYTQSRQSVVCPICGRKYLVLLDRDVYRRGSTVKEAVGKEAITYFSARLRETHSSGHQEDQLAMIPDEGNLSTWPRFSPVNLFPWFIFVRQFKKSLNHGDEQFFRSLWLLQFYRLPTIRRYCRFDR